MNWNARGRVVWQFGDHFNADRIVGSSHIGERNPIVLGKACLADFDPEFTQKMKRGDIMIAGRNFGYGNPHAEGVISLKAAGVSVLIAQSFYPVWYRIAIFHGFPVIGCPDILRTASISDELEVDIKRGKISNLMTKQRIEAEPFPEFLVPIVEAGGLVAHLREKLASAQSPLKGKG